jgi:hypothetical protein
MSSSTSPVPSYHLCPDFSIAPPPDGHLTLGSILTSLDNSGVSRPLNLNATIDIPDNQIFPRSGPDSKTGFTRSLKELRATEASIWAQIFHSIGPRFSFLRDRTDDETLTVDDMQTRYFIPDDGYITKSLQNSNVTGFIDETKKKVPLYMVTGLKVAFGAKLSKAKSKSSNLNAQVGVTDPQAVVSGGTTSGYTNEASAAVAFDGSSPFVLGFRVRKIWWENDTLKRSDEVAGSTLESGTHQGKASIVEGARYHDDFLVDDQSTVSGEVFDNTKEMLGVETSQWVIGPEDN